MTGSRPGSGVGGGLDAVVNPLRGRGAVLGLVAVVTLVVNLLLLTGPLYMIQVYDRVLTARSLPTLVALTLIMVFLFAILGGLDFLRGRILARLAFQAEAAGGAELLALAQAQAAGGGGQAGRGLVSDLALLRGFWGSPLQLALLDLPFTPLFLVGIFLFDAMLGWFALGAVVTLGLLAFWTQLACRAPLLAQAEASQGADRLGHQLCEDAETLAALGMAGTSVDRWQSLQAGALSRTLRAGDLLQGFANLGRSLRMIIQSLILGLGAVAVLAGDISAGAMFAATILMGRALQPVEVVVAQYSQLPRLIEARRRLSLLANGRAEAPHLTLPYPEARLALRVRYLPVPGGQNALLQNISLDLQGGEALGVIGPSGAGKTSLARLLVGALAPEEHQASLRLGGATLGQLGPDLRARAIGYLPQNPRLFPGTIAENIARMARQWQSEAVIGAARAAGAHELILSLPQGYETRIEDRGGWLSGGQVQRICLARALYGDPCLVVLDEPNAQLDLAGTEALSRALRLIKARGAMAVVIAHRPQAIQGCERVLALEAGTARAYGPRDEVLRAILRNHAEVLRPPALVGAVAAKAG